MSEAITLNLNKTTKRMVRYDAPEAAFLPAIQNIYIEKSALQEHYESNGAFPETVVVTISF